MYYYILCDPDKPTKSKLGITKNPDQRIKAYRTGAPQCYYYKLYKNIDKIHEKRILDIMRDIYRVDREFIHCNPSVVANIVDGYFSDLEINYLTTK